MPESGSYGSVGEPVGNHRLYPEPAISQFLNAHASDANPFIPSNGINPSFARARRRPAFARLT